MRRSSGGGLRACCIISARGLQYSWPDGEYVPRVARLRRACAPSAPSAAPTSASPSSAAPTPMSTVDEAGPPLAAAARGCEQLWPSQPSVQWHT